MPESPLVQLNDRQHEAVITTEGFVLVIAGAGSGKTRVLTERIAYLVREKNVPPNNILAFTFTNKAAREMKERLERSSPGISETLWVGTFHATGVRILRRHGDRAGIRKNFSIYDEDDSLGLIKGVLSRSLTDQRVVKSPRALKNKISLMKNELITPEEAAENAGNHADRKIASLYAQYESELRRANALDFDDLIVKVVELFSIDDDAKNYYSRRFRYVLVDEFQDTNPIQLAMIDALASRHGNLFVVGDDDQSIYSWRGAKVEHILTFEDVYPNTKVVRLEQNYRSTKTILDAANHVIACNVGRKGKNLWTDGPVGDKIKLMVSMDEETEAINVLQTVQAGVSAGLRLKDIAILYRTNAQSRALEEVLKLGSLPYQIIGSVRFYERAEVRDVLAYCKVLANVSDTVNLKRIINVPKRGIGRTSFEKLEKLAVEENVSIIGLMRTGEHGLPNPAPKRFKEFVDVFDRLEKFAAKKPAPLVVEKIVEETGYMDYLRDNYPDADSRIENVEEFVGAAHAFAEGSDDKSLAAFLEEIALVADVDALDVEKGQLTLMTLHNAKGLEFECVIITGLEDGLFPHYNSIENERQLEEERRLFYVGMTRSKKHLYLSMANMRRRMGYIEGGMPSRFLYEVPDRCLERTLEQSLGPAARSVQGDLLDSYDGPGVSRRGRARGEGEAPQRQPDYESFSQEEVANYAVGMRVRHDSYGTGIVRKVEGKGDQTRVTVIFDGGSERKFLAQFAPMRPA